VTTVQTRRGILITDNIETIDYPLSQLNQVICLLLSNVDGRILHWICDHDRGL